MIEFEMSTNTEYFVKIPYTDKYTYILKDAVIWNMYEKGHVYLVNDMDMDLNNEDGVVVDTVSCNHLQRISEGRIQDITEMYKKIRAIENNNGLVFTVDIKMFDSIIPDKDGMYHVRVPYTLGYIDVPLNNMFWLKENKTAQIFFENGKDIRYYSKNIAGNTQNARIVKTKDLKNYLEKKRKENKSNIREEVE